MTVWNSSTLDRNCRKGLSSSFFRSGRAPPPHLDRHWHHSHNKINQNFSLLFCILQAWTVGSPGNEASGSCPKVQFLASVEVQQWNMFLSNYDGWLVHHSEVDFAKFILTTVKHHTSSVSIKSINQSNWGDICVETYHHLANQWVFYNQHLHNALSQRESSLQRMIV